MSKVKDALLDEEESSVEPPPNINQVKLHDT